METKIVSYHVYFLNYFFKAMLREPIEQDFACLFSGNVYLMTFSRTVFLSNGQGHFGLSFYIVYLTLRIFVIFLGTYWYSLNLCLNCTRITYSNNQDFTTNSRLSVKLFEFVIIISNCLQLILMLKKTCFKINNTQEDVDKGTNYQQ